MSEEIRPVRAVAGSDAAIGIFDSGLGGLSVLRELVRALPNENFVYFADNLHLPYGPRPLEEVRGFAVAIAGRLIEWPAKIVVVACNAASAAALNTLRSVYPGTPFVGMEPAVKPAAAGTRSRKVGVLATKATFQGKLFESVVERFAQGTEVICHACPGLAQFIETHEPGDPELRPMLEGFIRPLVEQGIDRLVLACTHYPLVKEAIQEVAGPNVQVVDPSPAIARRTKQVLEEKGLLSGTGGGETIFLASGDAEAFSRSATRLMGMPVAAARSDFSRAV